MLIRNTKDTFHLFIAILMLRPCFFFLFEKRRFIASEGTKYPRPKPDPGVIIPRYFLDILEHSVRHP